MAFVASQTAAPGGAAGVPLPRVLESSGNSAAVFPFSHVQVSAGAGAVNIAYDGGATRATVPVNGVLCFAIPPGAQMLNVSAACAVAFGQMI